MTSLLAAAIVSVAGAAPDFDTFFKDFAQKRDAIQNMEAQFLQENETPEEVYEARGRIVFEKPRRIMFVYEKPSNGTTYLLSDNKAYVYQPDSKQLDIRGIEASAETEAFYLGFSDNTAALREAYDVTLFEPEAADGAAAGVTLKPKKEADSAPFKEVKLYLREQDYLPVRIHIVNDEDTQVDIRVIEIQTNVSAGGKVRLQVPEGAKIIEDDQVVETVGAGGKAYPADAAAQAKP